MEQKKYNSFVEHKEYIMMGNYLMNLFSLNLLTQAYLFGFTIINKTRISHFPQTLHHQYLTGTSGFVLLSPF